MHDKVNRPLYIDSRRHEVLYWVIPGLPLTIFSNRFGPDTFDYLDWHWHEELQFCLALEGDICVQVEEGSYPVTQGEAILINSCREHRICRDSKNATYICMNISSTFPCQSSDYALHINYKDPVVGSHGQSAYLITRNNPHFIFVLESLKKIWLLFESREFGYELDIWSTLLQLWKAFIQSIPNRSVVVDGPPNKDAIRLHRIISYIRREYANDFSLADVADSVFLSKSECCRFFKKAMGCSIFNYVTHYRVDKSIELLLQTNKKISVIAAETGFSSQSYYTECFKKQTGLTPKQFREMRKNSPQVKNG